MFANISPMTHVSHMTLDKAQLIHYIIQEFTVNAVELISEEIHKIMIL